MDEIDIDEIDIDEKDIDEIRDIYIYIDIYEIDRYTELHKKRGKRSICTLCRYFTKLSTNTTRNNMTSG